MKIIDEKIIIMLPKVSSGDYRFVSTKNCLFGTFVTELPGVRFHIDPTGIYLENQQLNQQVTINHQVRIKSLIKAGDNLKLDNFKLKYQG